MPDQNGNETLDERRARLIASGFRPLNQQQSTQTNVDDNSNNDDVSPLRSALSGAEENIGGTAGSIGGLVLSGIATEGASLIPAALTALGSSLVGGELGKKAQEAIEPNEMIQRHQAEMEANPTAAEIGQVAPMLLFAGPSGKTIGEAFTGSKTAIQSLGNTAMTAAQKQAIVNIAGGAGFGAANALTSSALQGELPSPSEVAENVILGGLLHEPWLLGPKVGLHPSANLQQPPSIVPAEGVNIPFSQKAYTGSIGPKQPLGSVIDNSLPTPLPNQPFTKASDTFLAKREGQAIVDESTLRKQDFIKAKLEEAGQIPPKELGQVDTSTDIEPTTIDTHTPSQGELLTANASNIDIANELHPLALNQFGEPVKPTAKLVADTLPADTSSVTAQSHTALQDRAALENETAPMTEAERIQAEYDRNDYGDQFQKGTTITPKQIKQKRDKVLSLMPEGPIKEAFKSSFDNYAANPEKGFIPPDLSKVDTTKVNPNVGEPKEGSTGKTKAKRNNVKPEIRQPADSQIIPTDVTTVPQNKFNVSKPIVDYLQRNGFKIGGNVTLNPDLQHPTGGIAAGRANLNKRTIELNPNTLEASSGETAVHEVVHQVINDSLSNPDTKPFMTRILYTLKTVKGQHPESAVTEVGKKVKDNLLSGKDAGFFKTLLSNLKLKLRVGNDSDAINALVEHAQNNAPYSERVGKIKYGGILPANEQFQPVKSDDGSTEKIVQAAIQGADGKLYTGMWHGDAFDKAVTEEGLNTPEKLDSWINSAKQGFLSNKGKFYTRVEASRKFSPGTGVVTSEELIPGRESNIVPIEGTTEENAQAVDDYGRESQQARMYQKGTSETTDPEKEIYEQLSRRKNILKNYANSQYINIDEDPEIIKLNQQLYFLRNIKPKQDQLLENFKKDLSERQMFKEIQVKKNPTVDNEPVYGYFDSTTKGLEHSVVKPDSTDTALHETIHRIFNKNNEDINNLIKHYVKVYGDTQVLKDTQDMTSTLATRHQMYKQYFDSLKNYWDINSFRNALDELVAQTSSNSFNDEHSLTVAHDIISKIFGEDFHNFIETESKDSKYFPNYRSDAIIKSQELQQKLDKIMLDIRTEKDKTKLQDKLSQAKTLSMQIQLIKNTNLGEYYQNGTLEPTNRLNSADDRVNSINLGLDKKEIVGTLKDKLPIILNPFRWAESDITKICNLPTREGSYIGDRLAKVDSDSGDLQGKYRGIVDSWQKLNSQQRDLLNRTLVAEDRNQVDLRSSLDSAPKLQQAYDNIKKTLREMQQDKINSGEMVADYQDVNGKQQHIMRLPEINPHYYPNMVNSDVYEALSKPGSAIYNKLRNDFIQWQMQQRDIPIAHATNIFNDFIESLGQARGATTGTRFGANRYAEGMGLPDSWIEPDPLIAMQRYLRRSTNDMAFFNNVESDPIASRIVGINKDQLGQLNPRQYPDGTTIKDLSLNQNIRNVLDNIQGRQGNKNQALEAGIKLITTELLGPISGTAVHIINSPVTISKYAAAADLPKIITAGLSNWKEGLAHAYENGFLRKDISLINDLTVPTTKLATKLFQLRNLVYKFNGRKLIEVVGKANTQAMAECLLEQNLARAVNGEQQFVKFFTDTLKVGNPNDPTIKAGIQATIPQLAKRIGEFVQGTYSYRTLPTWATDSSLSPIFQLARWHIEQTNHFYDHVIKPAANGNLQPLILTTLGSIIGGALIEEFKQKSYNKKDYLPSIQEMAASSRGLEGNEGNFAYKMMAMASYTGFAGMVGELARSSLDVLNKNNPQSMNFPAWGVVTDGVNRTMQAIQSIADGKGDYLDVGTKLASDLVMRNMQIARLVNTWLLDNGKNELQDKYRDLKIFKKVEGLPTNDSSSDTGNPYENIDTAEFKKETNPSKIAPELQGILTHFNSEYKNNPEGMNNALTGLKRMNYNTLPSPRTQSQLTSKYIDFIARTQGKAAAQALVQDYLRQNELNKAKSSLVPSLR